MFSNKYEINKAIDLRCEEMIVNHNMLNDVLDYWFHIRDFICNQPDTTIYEDILKFYNPKAPNTASLVKKLYPVTHSIGFLQALEFLNNIWEINQHSKNYSYKKLKRDKVKAGVKFLRDFKTATHQYTKKQHTWFKNQKRNPRFYNIECNQQTSQQQMLDLMIKLTEMSNSEYEQELSQDHQVLTSQHRTDKKQEGSSLSHF